MPRTLDRPELPPTAGLPPRWGDLLPRPTSGLPQALGNLINQDSRAWVTCSGTAALVVALGALARRSRRREVIVPAWTCPLVAIAIAHCGLIVRVCDLQPGHFDMDSNILASLCGPKTLAIVPTHLAGQVADVDTAKVCASACGAWVVEDAAQALGARNADGQPVGACGDIGIYSFAAGKGLSMYEGGLLTTRRADLQASLQQAFTTQLPWRWYWEARRCLECVGYTALYNPCGLRLVYGRPLRRALRHGDSVAAVGDRFGLGIPMHRTSGWREHVAARAAARLPDFLQRTYAQAQPRVDVLRAMTGIKIVEGMPGSVPTWPFVLLLLPDQRRRDAALSRLWTCGLGVSRLFIHALPDYAYLQSIVGPAEVPRARDFAARSLTISNTPWMGEETFGHIAAVLRQVAAG